MISIRKLLGLIVVMMLVGATLATSAHAAPGDLTLASTDDTGTKANGVSGSSDLSADGTKVAFRSFATNLDARATDGFAEIYVKDLVSGHVTLASTNDGGIAAANDDSFDPFLSADGTKVAFRSAATNLDPANTNPIDNVYVKDLTTGNITLASTDSAGVPGDGGGFFPALSADGNLVSFSSFSQLVASDTNSLSDIYVKNLTTEQVTLVSAGSSGAADGDSFNGDLSADGSHVSFESAATNLDPADNDSIGDIYVKDLTTGNITLASTADAGTKGNSHSTSATISADGGRVSFLSYATNLDPGDTDPFTDIYVKDLTTGNLTLASTGSGGVKGSGDSSSPTISADGGRVAFRSEATNLDPGDTDPLSDIYVKDLTTGNLTLASTGSGEVKGNGESLLPSLSADGTKVAFQSGATNLDPADTEPFFDVYVKELLVVPAPGLSIDDVTVTEGDSGTSVATFTISLSSPATNAVTVTFGTRDGTATAGDDYTAASGTVSFAPGESHRSVAVQIVGDTLDEPDETFFVDLSDPVNASIADGTGTVTIVNDDTPELSIEDVTVTEGNSGTSTALLEVSLSSPATSLVTVAFDTRDGTATAGGGDFSPADDVLFFGPGEFQHTIAVQLVGDTLDEPDETFFVDLSNPVNATIADGSGTVTITDDDVTPELSIEDVTVTEGNSGTSTALLKVSLSSPATSLVTVAFDTRDGTATAGGGDFSPADDVLFFGPGEFQHTIAVQILGDTLDEPDETFFVDLSNPVNASIADGSGTVTITDDDSSAHRALQGTITRLLAFAPGAGSGSNSIPLSGATVTLATGPRSSVSATTDAQGAYVFTNLPPCPGPGCPITVRGPGSNTVLVSRRVTLGPDPSTTTLDLQTGTVQNQLFLSGRVLAPGTPPTPTPTISIRVYRNTTLVFDSASLGGPGGFGSYRLALGQVLPGSGGGLRSGLQLRVALIENGTQVASTNVTVPALTGSVILVNASDLQAVAPPSAHRALQGTITRLLAFAPGSGSGSNSVPLAGATVTISTNRRSSVSATTDAQGAYAFTNLPACPGTGCSLIVRGPGSNTVLVFRRVSLGSDPSTTTLDLQTGTVQNQLFISGLVLAPVTPPTPTPTISIRVYRNATLVFDSASLGGPGGFGSYRLALGQVLPGSGGGLRSGLQLRVALIENGTQVASTNVTVPALTGSVILVNASDLQAS